MLSKKILKILKQHYFKKKIKVNLGFNLIVGWSIKLTKSDRVNSCMIKFETTKWGLIFVVYLTYVRDYESEFFVIKKNKSIFFNM